MTELDNTERLADMTIEYMGRFQIAYSRDDYGKWYLETMKELPER